jgi:hypothetical protein
LTTDPSKNSSKEQTYRPDKRRRREVKTQTRKCGGREFLRVHDSRSVSKMDMRKQEGKKNNNNNNNNTHVLALWILENRHAW